MKRFIDKNYFYAIVGATQNKEKYGYKVLKDLLQKGYNAVPINPNYEEIDGITCYPSLLDLDDRPDVVIIITPPEISLKIVEECDNLQLDKIWFQPGAEDTKIIEYVEQLGLNFMTDKCIIVETK